MQMIVEHFKKMLTQNQLAHAYIIDNISENLAEEGFNDLAKTLDVLAQDSYLITPEKTSIGVNCIREMTDRLSKCPIGKRHLVGINPADKLNTAACNALLKCLEEPPGNTCFVLFTKNARHLLPTIRSRSQILKATSQDLKAFESHSDFKIIQKVYRLNPGSIDSQLQGLTVYHAIKSKNPFLAIQILDIKPLELIGLTIQVVSDMLLDNKDVRLWWLYDKLLVLNKDYQQLQNLNEKGILDRVGLICNELGFFV